MLASNMQRNGCTIVLLTIRYTAYNFLPDTRTSRLISSSKLFRRWYSRRLNKLQKMPAIWSGRKFVKYILTITPLYFCRTLGKWRTPPSSIITPQRLGILLTTKTMDAMCWSFYPDHSMLIAVGLETQRMFDMWNSLCYIKNLQPYLTM